ncbi:MAG: DNA polymerase III subunit chi [Litorimonas sp.]
MTEYWFYHLEASSLKGVLPGLLEKTLQKGWRALVKLPEPDLADMDAYLWSFQGDSFLPHGRDDEPQSDQQPILLSASRDSAKGFDAVFLIGGASVTDIEDAARAMVMINGRDSADVNRERARWKTLKDTGAALAYYQQNERGSWEKKA